MSFQTKLTNIDRLELESKTLNRKLEDCLNNIEDLEK